LGDSKSKKAKHYILRIYVKTEKISLQTERLKRRKPALKLPLFLIRYFLRLKEINLFKFKIKPQIKKIELLKYFYKYYVENQQKI
jgi:hypothetical protein